VADDDALSHKPVRPTFGWPLIAIGQRLKGCAKFALVPKYHALRMGFIRPSFTTPAYAAGVSRDTNPCDAAPTRPLRAEMNAVGLPGTRLSMVSGALDRTGLEQGGGDGAHPLHTAMRAAVRLGRRSNSTDLTNC
jgi:hypothetical protein